MDEKEIKERQKLATDTFVENTLENVKNAIEKYIPHNIPLCTKPSEEKLKDTVGYSRLDNMRHDIFDGFHIKTTRFDTNETVWTYPEGVEEKIDDNKKYKVWYTWHDAADPADMSTYHRVYYIEEVPYLRLKFAERLREILGNILDDTL